MEHTATPISTEEVSHILNSEGIAHVRHGSKSAMVVGVAEFPPGRKEHISFCGKKELQLEPEFNFEGILFVSPATTLDFDQEQGTIFILENPRLAYALVAQVLFGKRTQSNLTRKTNNTKNQIHASAVIDSGATIGKNCIIGANVYISGNTVIGDYVDIGPNSSIGASGFGYAKRDNGSWVEIPQVGRVVIGNNVRIGANVCIDRAAISETSIGEGVKIDNHVHIAHNCEIGENTVITAGVEISGGVKVGNNVWIGPQVSILEKITVEDDVFIGIGSVVIRNVQKSSRIAGNPARLLPTNS
jgi:UDP-3-O-[3-hydroxymyristoyl] glucosamine N-acyltransferase